MRIAVISDIHGNLPALEAVLADLRPPERTLVVNPGSAGCPRRVDAKLPDLVEAGSPHARYAVTTRKPHGWMIELLAVPYDVTSVVARARQHRRQDWAAAFLCQVLDA
ncbi:MAG: metallophosphoesterase [Gemmatimonadales bacterium]